MLLLFAIITSAHINATPLLLICAQQSSILFLFNAALALQMSLYVKATGDYWWCFAFWTRPILYLKISTILKTERHGTNET